MRGTTKSLALGAACVIALATAGAANAANLVTNGSFETNGGNGQVGDNTTLSNWTIVPSSSGSYVYVFNTQSGTSGTSADHVGSVSGQYGNLNLWGPDEMSGSANGLTTSPDGGAFIGADPAFQNGTIEQTLTGLTAGAQYVVSFDYAGAEQYGHDGNTSEGWIVGFGTDPTQTTPILDNSSHGFTGWQTESFTFTATGTTDVLSFLATGILSGNGQYVDTQADPPFALLDGVSVTPMGGVPEPAAWAMMLLGLGGLGGALRMRRKQLFAAA